MYFSLLQRHILKECFAKKGEAVHRRVFHVFYRNKKITRKDAINTITKCMERLIDSGLLIGYGTRTTQKWFIREVKITRRGIKHWIEWIESRQAKLPF
jgi:hypothetical protein